MVGERAKARRGALIMSAWDREREELMEKIKNLVA